MKQVFQEVLEIKIFFTTQSCWQTFKAFLKSSFHGFYTLMMAFPKLSLKKGKNYLDFLFSHHQGTQNL